MNIKNHENKASRKWFSTTAFTGLIIAATNSLFPNSASAINYSNANNGSIIDTSGLVNQTSNLQAHGIRLNNVQNLTFNANSLVTTDNNRGVLTSGIFAQNSPGFIFEGDVTSSKNTFAGIRLRTNSSGQFKGNVTVTFNDQIGFHITESSSAIIDGTFTATNNLLNGISLNDSSKTTFNGKVTAINNQTNGIVFQDSAEGVFNSDVTAQNLLFSNSTGTATFGDGITFDAPVINSGINRGNLVFTGATTIKQQIGQLNAPVNKLQFTGLGKISTVDKAIYATEIDNGNAIVTYNSAVVVNNSAGTGITSSGNTRFKDTVTVNNPTVDGILITDNSNSIFDKDVTVNNSIDEGIVINANAVVVFNGKVTAQGNADKSIQINTGAQVTFNGDILSDNFHLFNSTGTTKFADGIKFDAPVTTNTANMGKLEFQGSVTLNNPIGTTLVPLAKIEFTTNDKTKTVLINEDITAQSVHLGGATFTVADGKTIRSTGVATTHLKNTTFNLGTGTTKFSGNVVHDAPAGVITFNTTYDGAKVGHIEQNLGTFNMKNIMD